MNTLNHSQKLAARSRSGGLLALFPLAGLLALATSLRADNPPIYLFQWGSPGTNNGQFNNPNGIAVDHSNNVYVVDASNDRIEKFDAHGNYLSQLERFVGGGNGQVQVPQGIAVDRDNNVYVVDLGYSRVEKFDSNGTFLTQWGSYGSGNGQFISPQGIAVDNSNNVYVVDANNYRIEKFDGNGNYLTQWSGQGNWIAVDNSNNVYVVNSPNLLVEKYDSNGNYLRQWGGSGAGNGQFQAPQGIAVDNSNNVYVTDVLNDRIEKFDGNGNYLTQWGSNGSGNGQFQYPFGITLDGSGNFIYVSDSWNSRVQVFINNPNIGQPFITSQPISLTVPAGGSATFSFSVLGGAPFAYQWSSNNVAVSGATNATFTLTNVSLSDSGGTYTVLVTNNEGSALSTNATLTVLPSVVLTQPADNITTAGAVLNGSVSVGTAQTTVWFEWGTDANYGNVTAQTIVPGNSASNNISAALSGLSLDAAYHFRLDASNNVGVVHGNDQSFLAAVPPAVVTLPATNIGTKQATFNATINPEGLDTIAYFRWGGTTNYGSLSAKVDVGSSLVPFNFNLPITNSFSSSLLWHFQVVASNSFGVAFGADVSFIVGPWVSTIAPIHNWDAIAASADGSKLVAVAYDSVTGGPIYTSTNSGATWISNSVPIGQWEGVASSADGTKLVVAGGGGDQILGPIYLSTNSGVTWTPASAPSNNWWSVASSADGTKLAAVDSIGQRIYTSADSGNTWTPTSVPSNYWASVASSADGSKLVAVSGAYNYLGHPAGPIYTSTNSGTTWISNNVPHAYWSHVSSSADGSTLLAVAGGNNSAGPIYTSTNSGATWVLRSAAGSREWTSSAISADGTKMAAVVDQSINGIFISTNSGVSWAVQSLPYLSWNAVASSADGDFLVASVGYPGTGGIYTLQTMPAPVLKVSAANNVLSWLIPSMGFTLQQSPDLLNWTDVANPPVLNSTNLQQQVALPPPIANTFYRLIH